jgi:hypothetical protein
MAVAVTRDVAPDFYPAAIEVWLSLMPCWAMAVLDNVYHRADFLSGTNLVLPGHQTSVGFVRLL